MATKAKKPAETKTATERPSDAIRRVLGWLEAGRSHPYSIISCLPVGAVAASLSAGHRAELFAELAALRSVARELQDSARAEMHTSQRAAEEARSRRLADWAAANPPPSEAAHWRTWSLTAELAERDLAANELAAAHRAADQHYANVWREIQADLLRGLAAALSRYA